MERTFVGRQPIFDRALDVVGYELLFRLAGADSAAISDGEAATSQVIVSTFTDGDMEVVLGGMRGFINVTRDFLLQGIVSALPPDRVVIEVLEDVYVDEEVMFALRTLAASGYTIALDDYADDGRQESLLDIAHIVKLDILALGMEGMGERVRRLRQFDVELVAEKVETLEELRQCHSLGFDYFQGYFLLKPETIERQSVMGDRLSTLKLLARLQDPDATIDELAEMTRRDIELSYRILRVVNSASSGLPRTVDSIDEAIMYLGIAQIARWVTLFKLAGIHDKPAHLTKTALVRAKTCELMAESAGTPERSASFTVGLFSLLDAFLDSPMAEIVPPLPLDDEIKAALLRYGGPLGELLQRAVACERGDWDAFIEAVDGADTLYDCYLDALGWAEETSRDLQA